MSKCTVTIVTDERNEKSEANNNIYNNDKRTKADGLTSNDIPGRTIFYIMNPITLFFPLLKISIRSISLHYNSVLYINM